MIGGQHNHDIRLLSVLSDAKYLDSVPDRHPIFFSDVSVNEGRFLELLYYNNHTVTYLNRAK